MHQAQSYICTTVIPAHTGVALKHIALGAGFVSGIDDRLKTDSLGYCYSGLVSIADAIRGIEAGFYSWGTVKLYYSAFYLARALLALKGFAFFYEKGTPYRWKAATGEMPKKLKGTTHQVVLDEFALLSTHPLLVSQQIDGIGPLAWLREKREGTNYGRARFEEPEAPSHFEKILDAGIRTAVEAYVADTTLLYAFDRDHAMLAYPIELLRHALTEIKALPDQYRYSDDDTSFLAGVVADRRGRFPGVDRLVRAG